VFPCGRSRPCASAHNDGGCPSQSKRPTQRSVYTPRRGAIADLGVLFCAALRYPNVLVCVVRWRQSEEGRRRGGLGTKQGRASVDGVCDERRCPCRRVREGGHRVRRGVDGAAWEPGRGRRRCPCRRVRGGVLSEECAGAASRSAADVEALCAQCVTTGRSSGLGVPCSSTLYSSASPVVWRPPQAGECSSAWGMLAQVVGYRTRSDGAVAHAPSQLQKHRCRGELSRFRGSCYVLARRPRKWRAILWSVYVSGLPLLTCRHLKNASGDVNHLPLPTCQPSTDPVLNRCSAAAAAYAAASCSHPAGTAHLSPRGD